MSRPSRLLALAALAATVAAAPAAAQNAYLVKDISTGTSRPVGSHPGGLFTFGGKVLFAATETSSGRELWVSDGSGSGTRLLADFCPGDCSSNPEPLGTAHGLLFGITVPETPGSEPSRAFLWRSDGTREGTFPLPDPLNRVALPYTPERGEPLDGPQVPLAFAADAVYFSGCVGNDGCSLWRSDGTAAGTVVLKKFPGDGFSGTRPTEVVLAGGRVFFSAYQGLWASDGTPAGTVQVKDFPQGLPTRLTALGNRLLFLAPAASPGTGEELWTSDGTAAGTVALTAFEPLKPFRQTHFLKVLGDKAYFVADDVAHGGELWASDGTAAGTVRLTDFGFNDPFGWEDELNDQGLFAWEIEKLGDRVVFWATDGLNGFKPWATRGTPATTAPVCTTCTFFGGDARMLRVGSRLVFFADEAVWTTDGTAAGTRSLGSACGSCVDVRPVLLGGAVYYLGPGAGDLYTTLWRTDGTAPGTRQFAALDLDTYRAEVGVAALGGKVLFGALTGADSDRSDAELWSSDGTPAGTRLVADVNHLGVSSVISQLTAVGGRVFFTGSEDGGDTSRVWRSDGTAAGTLRSDAPSFSDFGVQSRLATAAGKVFLIRAEYTVGEQLWSVAADGSTRQLTQLPESRFLRDPVEYQGKLFFGVRAGFHLQAEVWQSDGTPEGTHKAFDVPAEADDVRWLRVVGPDLWFLSDNTFDSAIWKSDGTTLGTRKILDGFRHPDVDPDFTPLGSKVYFIADKPGGDDYDYQVFGSDGTAAGTFQLTGFPGLNATRGLPKGLTAFQGALYFFANRDDGPRALWRSDGTSAGTAIVRAFPPQPTDFARDFPDLPIAVVGPHLVFAVDDGVHGREPWTSDGTAGGTVLLADVRPGAGGSGVNGFTATAARLWFAADDGYHGRELWRTDGTAIGTALAQDLAPEGASSNPAGLTVAGDLLFFSADDGLTGEELWALPLTSPGCRASATALCLSGGRYRVEARWQTPGSFSNPGQAGPGMSVPLSADTGYFWFFDPANVEAVVKVLDGHALNGHTWVFYGALSNVEYALTVTDTQTGLSRRYFNPQGQFASVGDTQGFGPLGAYDRKSLLVPTPQPVLVSERTDAAAATGTCVPATGRLCLSGGRFAVTASWKDFSNRTGTGTAVGLTGDTGYFWFFDPANVEAVVKVLDATAVNGHFWVYYGALSNVEYTLTVTDTVTGKVKTYRNPLGRFASAGDTAAF